MTPNEAVRALRKHVGETQQTFATQLGIAISSLSNYEAGRPIDARQLLAFYEKAEAVGRRDLGTVFLLATGKRLKLEGDLITTDHKLETVVLGAVLSWLRSGDRRAGPVLEEVIKGLDDKDRDWFLEEAELRGLINKPQEEEEK